MVAPGYNGSCWLWDCGYAGPWLWWAVTKADDRTMQATTFTYLFTYLLKQTDS